MSGWVRAATFACICLIVALSYLIVVPAKLCSRSFGNATGLLTCIPCGPGTYNGLAGQSSATACQICSVGTYNGLMGQSSIAACQACAVGTYNGLTGQSVCLACTVGAFNNLTGQSAASACQACGVGTYNDQTGQSRCLACGVNTFNNLTGQTSIVACLPCGTGTFHSLTGQSSATACLPPTPTDPNAPDRAAGPVASLTVILAAALGGCLVLTGAVVYLYTRPPGSEASASVQPEPQAVDPSATRYLYTPTELQPEPRVGGPTAT